MQRRGERTAEAVSGVAAVGEEGAAARKLTTPVKRTVKITEDISKLPIASLKDTIVSTVESHQELMKCTI
ncbi:hypothetical protein AHAS_Ahas18G0087000 [Arachis hypogaea]